MRDGNFLIRFGKRVALIWVILLMVSPGGQVHLAGMEESPEVMRAARPPSTPAAGVFLVAESHLRDPNFSRSVVLIIQHSDRGSLGIIVNRPSSTPLGKIWKDLEGSKNEDNRLFLGGPVQHETFGMLYMGDKEKNNHPPVFKNVFYSNNPEHLVPIAKGTAGGATAFRVYVGYAGWAAGQLQSELNRGDWRLVGGVPEAIFQADTEVLWSQLRAETEQKWISFPPPREGPLPFLPALSN